MAKSPNSLINILGNEIKTFLPKFTNSGDIFINSNKEFFRLSELQKQKIKLWFGINDLIPHFTGREKEIEKLHKILEEKKIVVINGLGGIGKTELARKYTWEKGNNYENVIWINSETNEYLEESIYKLATEINIPIEKQRNKRVISIILDEIYDCFLERNCLIVFDNVTSMNTIKKYIPNNKYKIYTIITSQNTEWGNINCVTLDVLTEKESIELVTKSLEELPNETDVIKLVRLLHYLPLALQQAIAYITDKMSYVNKNFTIKDYINKFEKEVPILNHRFDGAPFPDYTENNYKQTVYVTFTLNLNKVKKAPKAMISLGILFVVAYLAPEDIPRRIFLPLTKFNNEEELDVALRNITKYSIMSEYDNKLRIHRLIQQILRYEFDLIKHHNFLKIALDFVLCDGQKDSAHSNSVLCYAQDLKIIKEYYDNNVYKRRNLLYSLAVNGCLQALQDIDSDVYSNQQTTFQIIFAATKNGHSSIVTYFIDKGASINCQDENGWTHLHQAAYYNKLELCKIYINQGVDVNVKSVDGWTPLHFASQAGHFEVVKYLIQNHANVNTENNEGFTPFLLAKDIKIMKFLEKNNAVINHYSKKGYCALHLAVINGETETLEYLIEKFEANTCISNNGVSPIHIATDQGNLKCIEFLIKNNFDVNYESVEGVTAMRLAIEAGHFEIVKYLDQTGAKYIKKDGWSQLHICAYLGHLNLLKYFINKGLSPNESIEGNWTVLHLAVDGNHEKILEYLLSIGVKHVKNDIGYFPLHYAAYYSKLNLLQIFVDQNLSLELKTNDGRTSLHFAAEKCDLEVLEFLFENNVNVNETTEKGLTALHLAAEVGHLDVIKMLINHGALVNIKTKHGVTAFHLACKANNVFIAKYLIENGALVQGTTNVGFTALHIVAEKSNVSTIQFLLDINLDINQQSFDGWTPLNTAILGENIPVVKFLINKSADINIPTNEGMFPLHIAAYKGNLEIIKLLVQAGADCNVKNKYGNTPLQLTVASGSVRALCFLIDKGADVNSLDIDKDSPLHSAVECNNLETVKILVENGANVNSKNLKGETPLDLAYVKGNKGIISFLKIESEKQLNLKY